MKNHFSFFLLFILLFFSVSSLAADAVAAENYPVQDSLVVKFTFFRSGTYIDFKLADNEKQYKKLRNYVNRVGSIQALHVKLSSSASPEGTTEGNMDLCYRRSQSTQKFLFSHFPAFFTDNTQWQISFEGDNWPGVRREVEKSDLKDRDEVINIIDNTPIYITRAGKIVGGRKKMLMDLHGGRTWKEMDEKIFPQLRYSILTIQINSGEIANDAKGDTCQVDTLIDDLANRPVVTEPITGPVTLVPVPGHPGAYYPVPAKVDSLYMYPGGAYPGGAYPGGAYPAGAYRYPMGGIGNDSIQYEIVPKKVKKKRDRKPIFAAKTNLLFDLGTALNFELEFPIKNKVSILGEIVFPWWIFNIKEKYYALELMQASLECRYWFGNRQKRPLLEGWFLGVYAAASYYDFEWNNKGIQGESYIQAGLTAGYSFKIGTNWRFETSLGVGYAHNEYREYEHRTDLGLLVWQRNGKYDWIGPTKLKCSISWLIPNYPKKKKGGKL